MTLPFLRGTERNDYARKRANWLGRYLDVERSMDREVYTALSDALVAVDSSLVSLVGNESKSAATRRLQLALTHKEIRSHLTDLFGNVESTIKDYHGKAAVAAADAALADQKRLLRKMFTGKGEAEAYGKSLQATAQRNIETVMTRVLETQRPLSKRVYKTKALSQGLVDRAINNGLARGDSFTKIANDVKSLIDPRVPGGVTYAAKRLARTETNNAFHAQSIHDAQEMPWVTQMRWNLSKVHKPDHNDPCEDYAQQGLFQVEHVPDKPHPHCRCFVTPEPVDDDTFDHAFKSGQYDSYLDDYLGDSQAPVEMDPSPTEPSTTKAAQPSGWTGPPVAKAAANKQVKSATDDIWLENYDHDPHFLQKAREGSRTVQVKGYKGGLSSPGKKAILDYSGETPSDSMAVDVGRELTARLAYASDSTTSVYRRETISAGELAKLKSGTAEVSMPLSHFDTSVYNAYGTEPASTRFNTIVWEVQDGAKVADVGSRRVTMGHFDVVGVATRKDPIDGEYHVIRLRQKDIREFEAVTPKGATIPDWEFVTDGASTITVSPPKPVVTIPKPPPPPPRPKVANFAQTVSDARTHQEVSDEFFKRYPSISQVGWNENQAHIDSVKEVAVTVDKLMQEYPDNGLEAVEFSNQVGEEAYAHVQAYYDYNTGGFTRSVMRISPKYAKDRLKYKTTVDVSVKTGWSVAEEPGSWNNTVTHEFGHVLDNTTDRSTRSKLNRALRAYYRKTVGPIDSDYEYHRWLQGTQNSKVNISGLWYNSFDGHAPSGYSVSRPDATAGVNKAEIIAESFADVKHRGSKANPIAKLVVSLLEKELKKNATV